MRPSLVAVAVAVWVALVGALAACRSTPPTVKLELADAKLAITAKDGATHTVALTKAGALSLDGATFATLTGNGTLLVGGKPVGNVDPDGSIRIGKELTNAKVKRDGTFVLAEVEELTIAADGAVTGPLLDTIDHPQLGTDLTMRYDGPSGARRPLMVGFATLVTSLPAVAVPPAAAPAPAPAPN